MKTRSYKFLFLFIFALLVIGMGLSCVWWVEIQQRQYAINQQLIAVLTHDDTKTALALINAGADPNTRYDPPPVPTFKLMFQHLLHHTPLVIDDTPTAFQYACDDGCHTR